MTRPLSAAQEALAKAMLEKDLEEQVRRFVVDLAKHGHDIRRYHTLRPKGSPAGWLDDVIAGPGGVLYRELKREGQNPTADQQWWLDRLAAHGADVGVWRPTDLLSGRIKDEILALL